MMMNIYIDNINIIIIFSLIFFYKPFLLYLSFLSLFERLRLRIALRDAPSVHYPLGKKSDAKVYKKNGATKFCDSFATNGNKLLLSCY